MIEQPFKNASIVKCIRDSKNVWVDGTEVGLCACGVGNEYTVEFMVWSSISGWLIATPKPFEGVRHELHKACDFEQA